MRKEIVIRFESLYLKQLISLLTGEPRSHVIAIRSIKGCASQSETEI